MSKVITIIFLCFCLLSTYGCATATKHHGSDLSQAKIEQLVEGRTTKAEVYTLFGKPMNQTRQPNGSTTMSFSHTELKSVPQLMGVYLPTQQDMLICTFGPDGILQNYMLTTSDFMRSTWQTF